MQESDLYGPLWNGANGQGWHLFRIADGSDGKKPCDIAGIAKGGVGVCLEAKILRDGRPSKYEHSPCWSAYKVHQVAWLGHYAEANALALAVEYDVPHQEMKVWVLTCATHFALASEYTKQIGIANSLIPYSVVMQRAHHPVRGSCWIGWDEVLAARAASLPWNGPPLGEYRKSLF